MQRKYHQHKIKDPPSLSIRGGQTVPSFTRQVQSREFSGTVTHCPATSFLIAQENNICHPIVVFWGRRIKFNDLYHPSGMANLKRTTPNFVGDQI